VHDDSNSYKIFHRMFLVNVAQIALINPEYLKTFGLASTGDRNLDRQVLNDMTSTYLSINAILEIRRKGYHVQVVGEFDIMYEIIVGHIHDWLDILAEPILYKKPPPLDDIQDLEILAQGLHPFVTNKKLMELGTKPRAVTGTYLNIGTKPGHVSLGETIA
jgi:hypothetical protein